MELGNIFVNFHLHPVPVSVNKYELSVHPALFTDRQLLAKCNLAIYEIIFTLYLFICKSHIKVL